MSLNPGQYRVFETRPPGEEYWSAREELFNAHGYKFRPRLRKEWTPSWHTTGKSPLHSEDGEILKTHLVDAYTDEGKCVCIKRVLRNDEEPRIAQMLSTKELRADPRNHCVPIIEVIDDPDDDSVSYMVMPLLRMADLPPFQYVKEIVDFMDQTLEGLVFIHENGVAHRDCVMRNFLMDADAMYPEGFHPVNYWFKRDYSGWATHIPRSVAGVRYYFADFGISVRIPEEEPQKFVTGTLGRDQEPPELSDTVPYDPFKLDIFIIGNMLRQEFCDKFTNTDFLRPLAQWMTNADPEQRPTAKEVLRQWLETRQTISVVNMEWRPRPRMENILGT
ncbi:kinase-like protein, partial [Thelephora ganbajun]